MKDTTVIKYWTILADYGYGDVTTYGNFQYISAARKALRALLADNDCLDSHRLSIVRRQTTIHRAR
jgi:hypothetical protein